ncbi:hypothetical protein UQW22_02830 [Isoptericola halotolerans]|uniref:hypothetical protein n=1 Tax=Isoptericola halotolerans TaxID=300560 RepID=UPI00388D27C2
MARRQPDSQREGTHPTGPPEVLDDVLDAVWPGLAPCTMLEDVLTTTERRQAVHPSAPLPRSGAVPGTTTEPCTAAGVAA